MGRDTEINPGLPWEDAEAGGWGLVANHIPRGPQIAREACSQVWGEASDCKDPLDRIEAEQEGKGGLTGSRDLYLLARIYLSLKGRRQRCLAGFL